MNSSLITYLIIGTVAATISVGSVGTSVAADDWVFRGGVSDLNTTGTYPANVGEEGYPGARQGAATWTDSSGNFWMFGGFGLGESGVVQAYLGDLWMYEVSSLKWIWKGGSKTDNALPTYPASTGIVGIPGARSAAARWVDSNYNLWMFGGDGMASDSSGALADTWKYDPLTGDWTWEGGATTSNSLGDYSAGLGQAGEPAARFKSACSTTQAGDFLLFGGRKPGGAYNDMWKFSATSKTWTWIAGSQSVNQDAVFPLNLEEAGYPNGRYGMAYYTDENYNFWIFAGYGGGAQAGIRNDLWKYNPSNETFYWMNGSKTSGEQTVYPANHGDVGTLGGRSQPQYWFAGGKLWAGGGYGSANTGFKRFNDLWAYNLSEKSWRFMDGGKGEDTGTDPLPALGDTGLPTGRMDGQVWTFADLLILFGGSSSDGTKAKTDFWYHPSAISSSVADWQLF